MFLPIEIHVETLFIQCVWSVCSHIEMLYVFNTMDRYVIVIEGNKSVPICQCAKAFLIEGTIG